MSGESVDKAIAFVVARLSSSRLPNKQLRQIGGRSILHRIMQSLAGAAELDRVVLATVAEPDNEPLRELAIRHDWELFWYQGEVDDVVGRLCQAADAYQADICLLISADCPLVHAPSVDQLVRQLRAAPEADFLTLPADAQGRDCLLEGVQVARRRAWQAADRMSDRPEQREHQFPVLHQYPERFRAAAARLDSAVYGQRHRFSVDTWADLEFMQTLHRHLNDDADRFELPDVLRLLDRQPQLRQINQHVHQRRLVESVHPVLFVVDAGGRFGYGHLMRSRELAAQLVERLGWPVGFVLDDRRAARLAEDAGFRVYWGALERDARTADTVREAFSPDLAARHGLVVVDVSVRRGLSPDWRRACFADRPVVVMDRDDAPAGAADLIVHPGVSGTRQGRGSGPPAVLEGLEYVILRREVRRLQHLGSPKDIDVLVYLQDRDARRRLERLAERQAWHLVVVDGFRDDFAELLARSRIYLSGYGQSFYEALALGSFPVALPLSPVHRADAEAFYRATGLPDSVLDHIGQAERVIGARLVSPPDGVLRLEDGCPAIIREFAGLRERWA